MSHSETAAARRASHQRSAVGPQHSAPNPNHPQLKTATSPPYSATLPAVLPRASWAATGTQLTADKLTADGSSAAVDPSLVGSRA